jgi:nucleotide-binding universal stress UspA family protein
MPAPIVVGLDTDRAPLLAAATLARIAGAPLVAVHAYRHDPISNAVSAGTLDDDLRAAGRRELAALVGDVEAELIVRGGGSAAAVVHDVAVTREAALVVVGSTRRGPLGRIAPGTTAERLTHGAPCPVLLVPAGLAPDWSPRRVGVGFVDVPDGRAAVDAAAALARAAGATLHAVTAIEQHSSAAVAPYREYGEGPVAGAERALEALGAAATTEVVTGPATDALVALSGEVDLLVCGSRGYGPVRSVLLGGVTHGLVRRARCPLLIVPRARALAEV